MFHISIKPLSVNKAWKGRRFKTDDYKNFQDKVVILLRRIKDVPVYESGMIVLYEFGFSSRASDWDNCIKNFQDILQKRIGFDDKIIVIGIGKKTLVKKGEEFIKFSTHKYTDDKYEKIKEVLCM